MKLPWVPRSLYEASVNNHTTDRDLWLHAWTVERDRSERLTDQLLALKREGFMTREPERFTASDDELPAEVVDAILGRAGSLGNDLSTQLTSYARDALRQKVLAEEIARQIWDGDQGEGEE